MKPDFSPISIAKIHIFLLIATNLDKKVIKKCDFNRKEVVAAINRTIFAH